MRLDVVEGQAIGRWFELPERGDTVIGRDLSADIHLDDSQCSRRHARVCVGPSGDAAIEDLDSTNGLYVNGLRLPRAILENGDRVRLGNTLLAVSGLEPRAERTTLLRVCDEPSSVVVALDHDRADLLGRTAEPVVAAELTHENRMLRQICEITQIVAGEARVAQAIDRTLERARDVLEADTVCILERAGVEGWTVRPGAAGGPHADEITVSGTIVRQAVSEGVAILFEDTGSAGRPSPSESIVASGITSALCSPLKVNEQFVGVLFIDRRGGIRRAFGAMDLRFAASVGNILSVLMENEQLQQEARQRERLATIGEVMTGLAHYAKNIITGLKFGLATLRKVLESGRFESAPEYLERIAQQERRISDLVLDMLSYAKERQPIREVVELGDMLEQLVAPYRAQLVETNIELELRRDPDCPPVWAEERSLHRLFLNLLTNAIDAIGARDGDGERRIAIHVSAVENGWGARVRFRDSGVGIRKAELDRIFDVFYSTKGSGGTGLGLAVARKTVEEHNGRIHADSEEGCWTEFVVELPVQEADDKKCTGPAAGRKLERQVEEDQ